MSRNPTRVPWATDDDHPIDGDPWEGLDTKVEPSAGRKAEGFEPDTASPAQHMNWLIHQIALFLDFLHIGHGLNWHEADVTDATIVDFTAILAGCYSPPDFVMTWMDNDGVTVISQHPGGTTSGEGGCGIRWDEESASPGGTLTWTAAATIGDITAEYDASGPDADRMAVSNSAAAQVGFSTSHGTWAAPGGISGSTWSSTEYGDGTWVIGGLAGALRTNTNPGGASFVTRTSGLSGNITRIRSNRKSGVDHVFVAIDDAGLNVAVSTDAGVTWAAAAHGMTGIFMDVTWDKASDQWVAIQNNGYRAFSADGVTWTEDSDTIQSFIQQAGQIFTIDADDHGGLILTIWRSGGAYLFYVSGDSGETWREVYYYDQPNFMKRCIAGGGIFCTVGSSGVLISDRGWGDRT